MMRILQRDALITVLVALAFMCRIAPANAADAPAPANPPKVIPYPAPAGKWELVWSDDFNYNGLPDSTKWDYEEGYRRNHESQYYTRGRLENARVEGGHLIIECRKEDYKPANGAVVKYTSASLLTRRKANENWLYGRIEARAKLPQGKGVWPAFWMLGTTGRWPAGGEIDIMEFLGREPNKILGTLHFAGPDGRHAHNGGELTTDKPYDDFHIYAVEWYPDRIDFFFDTTKYHTVQLDEAGKGDDNPFRHNQYLIVNLALGGGAGGPIDDAVLPQQYVIDYVRVYQQKPDWKEPPAEAGKAGG